VNAISRYRPKELGFVWKKAPLFASLMFCLTSFAFGADVGEAGGQRKLDPRLFRYSGATTFSPKKLELSPCEESY
jgi:hypothetical protein